MDTFYRKGRLIEWDPENPAITCLMSVYNGEKFLKEAIDSILNQTYTNFEFLIINDGSTDDSVKIIESYDDPRIRLVHNEQNIGLTKSLNKGIDLAKGKYIARMDADDVSLEERFEMQLKFMGNNKSLTMVADKAYYTFGNSKITEPSDIDIELFFHNCIAHSSVFFRNCKQNKIRYDEKFLKTQDYKLWTSSKMRGKIGLIGRKLVNIRNHANRLSVISNSEQIFFLDKVIEINLKELNLNINKDLIEIHKRISSQSPGYTQYFILSAILYFEEVLQRNKEYQIYDHFKLIKRIKLYLKKYLLSFRLNLHSNIKTISYLISL